MFHESSLLKKKDYTVQLHLVDKIRLEREPQWPGNYYLQQGSTNFSLSQTAFAIHIYLTRGPHKYINNIVEDKQNHLFN
jgi:hypothetical protein